MNMSTKLWKSLCGALLVAVMTVPGVSKAVTYTDLASWEAAVTGELAVDLSSYVGTTVAAGTGIDLAGMASMSLDVAVSGVTVGAGWATWADGRTPDILVSAGDIVTATFSPDVTAFGVVMEPNDFDVFTMDVVLSDGTVISQDVAGLAGASFFGWAGQAVSSITMTCQPSIDQTCQGFAFGEMVIAAAAVPEAGSLVLLSLGLLTLGAGAMRRRNKRA